MVLTKYGFDGTLTEERRPMLVERLLVLVLPTLHPCWPGEEENRT